VAGGCRSCRRGLISRRKRRRSHPRRRIQRQLPRARAGRREGFNACRLALLGRGFCPSSTTTRLPADKTLRPQRAPWPAANALELSLRSESRDEAVSRSVPPRRALRLARRLWIESMRICCICRDGTSPKCIRACPDHFGLVSDVLAECFSRLRSQSRIGVLQGRLHFGGALSGRAHRCPLPIGTQR